MKLVGNLPLPITLDQAESLKESTVLCHNISDDIFTKVWQIESDYVKITNPEWNSSLRKLLDILASKLGVDPCRLSANLESLLYMERGSSIDWCFNKEEKSQKVGTLLVQLPSYFSGGSFQIHDGKERQDKEEDESKISNFDLGEVTGEHEFKCHVLCHYTDCQYKMERIKSGYRLLLCYSLRFNNGTSESQPPSAALINTSKIPLRQSLDALPRHDRIILIPLTNEYRIQ